MGGKLAVVRYRLKKNIIREGNRHVGGLVEGLKVLKVWVSLQDRASLAGMKELQDLD